MLHAVIRLDRLLLEGDAAEHPSAVTIVAVLPTLEEADELDRLMRLRDDDDLSVYVSMPAPYHPGGRSAAAMIECLRRRCLETRPTTVPRADLPRSATWSARH